MGARARRIPPPTIESVHIPAPTGGLNTVSPASAMPAEDCLQAFNMIAGELGFRVRRGYVEWCNALDASFGDSVNSILPFTGSAKNGANDRLFAVSAAGITNVSASGVGPVLTVAFPSNAGEAGWGVCVTMVTAAGHFLIYCDEENGLYVYTEATTTWAKVTMGAGATQINGVDPAKFAFCMVWKNRLWFVEKDTANAWYMAAGALYGAATKFTFGQRFRAGGDLRGLWSWTIDGGIGIDDYLVAISGGGDIVIYQGTDPAVAASFSLRGVWYVGQIPAGRRVATDFGGDLLVICRLGLLPLSRLVSSDSGLQPTQYETWKIGNTFSALAAATFTIKGWSVRLHPEDNAIIVTVPTAEGQSTTQLVMSLAKKSWTAYRDLPIYSCESWGGKLYFGTIDQRVCVNTGYVDAVPLSDPNAFAPVQWSCLTAFQDLGNARQKQVQIIKPKFLSGGGATAISVAAKYGYDMNELAPVSLPAAAASDAWDSAIWDASNWSGDYSPNIQIAGAVGCGVEVAIAIRGVARGRTVLVGFDVSFTQGGIL